jgi:hypothetical protein
MIMEHHAGDRMAAAGAGRGPRSAGEPRSRLHSSNGPPPGSPPRPAGCRRRGDAAGSPGPVARPGAGGTGSQHRRALMVAARPWVTSTMVSCCCPGSYNKASWLYPAARGTAETAHRRCDPGAGRPDLGRRGREPTRAGADRAGRRPGRAGAARPRRQPARAPARRTRPRTWILTQLAPAPRPGEGGFTKPPRRCGADAARMAGLGGVGQRSGTESTRLITHDHDPQRDHGQSGASRPARSPAINNPTMITVDEAGTRARDQRGRRVLDQRGRRDQRERWGLDQCGYQGPGSARVPGTGSARVAKC